jgi:tetratricopeptide (TPR) repeat protein
VKAADLPPDASYVQGFVPILKRFYNEAGVHQVWLNHQKDYNELIERFHDPVNNLLLSTDVYLKLPLSGYVGRRFTIYLEPLAAPGQVNSRNYGVDYFMVVSPERGNLKLEQIRHAYLHYVLDPLALKRANVMKRLQPLLPLVRTAPMDDAYKGDAALLVTESLIRAIEARGLSGGKAPETVKTQAVEKAMAEGFILTRHFYEQLVQFEQSPVGLKDAYGDWLFNINVDKEKKRTAQIQFARSAAPEVVRAGNPRQQSILEIAERQLAEGNAAGAQQLAEQALNEKTDNPGRALYILAKAAVLTKNIEQAQAYFERALGASKEPALVAWSHIYLGRIFDLHENREAALEHYRAALAASDAPPETRAAAQRGIEKPYAPPERKSEQ